MPYSQKLIGIYSILNRSNGKRYVGQSRNLKKRLTDHLNLLRAGRHPNPVLLRAFRKHGEESFQFDIEILCDDTSELNDLEQCFLDGEAYFGDQFGLYNISKAPVAGMTGRSHTTETKKKISISKAGRREHVTDSYRESLKKAAIKRSMSDPSTRRIIKLIIENEDMRNCDLAKLIGKDQSTCKKMSKRFRNLNKQGVLNGFYPL